MLHHCKEQAGKPVHKRLIENGATYSDVTELGKRAKNLTDVTEVGRGSREDERRKLFIGSKVRPDAPYIIIDFGANLVII